MKFKKYYLTEAKVVHWKESKWAEYAACDRRRAENLKLTNVKHTTDYSEITCKKCKKHIMGVKRRGRWIPASSFKYI